MRTKGHEAGGKYRRFFNLGLDHEAFAAVNDAESVPRQCQVNAVCIRVDGVRYQLRIALPIDPA